MEQTKYDVFISYSRKDYVDEQEKIISGNIISQIKDSFQNAGIRYWFDEEGIYSGDKYMEKLADAIFASTAFVFISSKNSNASEWTAGEIGTAHLYKKKIIPFRLDDSPFARSIIVKIAHLDYIDCDPNPDKAIKDLVSSVLAAKDEEEKKQREEDERRKKERMKARRAEIQQEIQNLASDLRRVSSQQQNVIEQIIEQKSLLEETDKTCPICQKKAPLSQTFCERCGFTFPLLYGLANTETDTVHLAILQGVWKEVESQQSRRQELEEARKVYETEMRSREASLNELSGKCSKYEEIIKQKEDILASNQEEILSLSKKLEQLKQETILQDKQRQKNRDLISKLQEEIDSLKQHIQNKNKAYQLLEDKYNKIARSNIDTEKAKEANTGKRTELISKAPPVLTSSLSCTKVKPIKTLDEAFSIIETCCNTSPIQDNYDFNKAKLSLNWLKNILGKKYNLYVSKTAILACKNIGELKQLLYNSSNRN